MPRYKKPELKMIEVTFECRDKIVKVEVKDYELFSNESSCELCGSHGTIKVTILCPVCDKYHTLELNS